MALGAFLNRLGREFLDFFKAIATLGAAIGIQRQSSQPPYKNLATLSIVSAGRQITGKPCRPASICAAHASIQCTMMCTVALLFSQARVSVPLPPPKSLMVYFRFSTRAGRVVVCNFALPRSCALS